MQKLTWTALTLAATLPTLAAPTTTQSAPKKAPVAASKTTEATTPANKTTRTTSTTTPTTTTKKTTTANKTAPVLLSKTLTPDGKTPVLNVKNTLVPDVQPVSTGYYVLINIPQQRLFLFNNGALEKVYPVAVGKAMTQTNLGEHKIGGKAYDPTWHIPKSIQAEMKTPQTSVPPGPNNPLGPVFVRLGNPKLSLGIHGTNAPNSVPGVRSHGCVRMKSEQALDFARTITTGSDALVGYEMAALNVDGKNQLWLAAYQDPYNKKNLNIEMLKKSIKAWAKENNVNVSDALVNQTLKAKKGTPVCLTCKGKGTIQGNLMSLAWNSGSASLTTPKGMNTALPPVQDDTIESGEIEIDAGDDVPVTKTPTKTKTVAPSKTTKNTKNAVNEEEGTPLLPEPTSVTAPSKSKTSKPAPTKTEPVKVAPAKAASNKKNIEVKSTSVFDDDTVGERPLLPVQPMDLKPTTKSK